MITYKQLSLADTFENCQAVDSSKADMTIFDTSGIEAWVTENNPKYANKIIKQLKAYAKANNFDSNYDPYKAAYGSMPSHWIFLKLILLSIQKLSQVMQLLILSIYTKPY